jgi:hypothetical protein
MTTRSGRQYTLPSTIAIPITPANPVTTVSPPKWSHKELFGSLDLANTQGGLHDLPKKVDSWIPRFSGEGGSYGNSHWTKFCEGFEFHQSGQEHPDVFMRLFASSLTGSARGWINGLPNGSIKTPEDLERAFKDRWCKKESMASFYSQFLEVCKQTDEDVREFNDRFNTLISKLQPDFLPKSIVLQHYLNSFEGTLQFTLKDRLPTTLEEAQDVACQIEENLKFGGAIYQVNFLNNDDIWEINKESMGGLEHDLPEILEVENNTFHRKWSTGFSNMKDALNFSKQHEPSEDLSISERITQLERSLSQIQKPLSMRPPQTIKSHAPREQICLNTLDLQNVARQENDPKPWSCKDSYFERYHPKATHEKPNFVDSIFTLFTPSQTQENQDMRKPRIEYFGQTNENSRVKLEEPQVYTSNLPQHFPKPDNNRTNLSTSMAYILQKVKRIREMLEIPSLTKQIPDDQLSSEETSTLLQTGHFEQNEQTPFQGHSDYNSVDSCLFQGWPTLPSTEEDNISKGKGDQNIPSNHENNIALGNDEVLHLHETYIRDSALVGPRPIVLEQERDTNWGDYPDDASDISEDLDDYSSTQEDDYLMRFRRKGVGFVKWEGDDIGTSKTHEPTKESLPVFSPDDFPFASEEDFDQIQWPKKEEYQQLLDKYKDKEVGTVKLLKKEEDDMLIKPSQQEVFTAESHPPPSRQYTRVVQETTKFKTKRLQRGRYSMDVGHKEGRAY